MTKIFFIYVFSHIDFATCLHHLGIIWSTIVRSSENQICDDLSQKIEQSESSFLQCSFNGLSVVFDVLSEESL